MRETIKEVKHEVDGQEMTFQIRKMDAMSGSYLMKFCAEKFLPVLSEMKNVFGGDDLPTNEDEVKKYAAVRTDEIISMIPKALSSLTEEELVGFEKRCLKTVSVLKPAGWQPVLTNGGFGVEELEYDVKTVLLLCYEVAEFNLGSFFGGKSLTSFLKSPNT